jgi:hypothetical protein
MLFVISVIFIHVAALRLTGRALSRNFYFIVAAILSSITIMAAEQIFYQGDFSILRYAMVTQLLTKLSFALALILALNTIWVFKSSGHQKLSIMIPLLAIITVLISSPPVSSAKSSFDSVVAQSRVSTEEFQMHLDQISSDTSAKEFSGIVIQINNVWDYEPAYAFSQYLEFYGNGLPRNLLVTEFSVAPGLESKLLAELKDYELNGDSVWLVKPKAQIVSGSLLYCVTINRLAIVGAICSN